MLSERPGMYIGDTDDGTGHTTWFLRSLTTLLMRPWQFLLSHRVIIHEDDSITVKDNGRGIPVDKHKTEKTSAAEVIMTYCMLEVRI